MTLLKQETLYGVIDAAIEAGFECAALLLSIPRDAQSSLVKLNGRTEREQFLSTLSQLNDWGASNRKDPPLRTLMHNMQFLAGMRPQAQVFRRALDEIDGASSSVTDQGELLFLRAKDCYVVRGYRVVPPMEAPTSLTFQAWRGTSAVSVIGVAAVASLEVVIHAVKSQVEQLASWDRVEGCVVLGTQDLSKAEQVQEAGLTPVPYGELAPMGVREVTALVDRQQSELAQEQAADGQVGDNEICREVRAALREGPVRVVTVSAPQMMECARRIVLRLTSDYLRDPARAAPLLLPLPTKSCRLQDLVAAAFNERKVPFSRFDFPGLLAENAFLPIFAVSSGHSLVSDKTDVSPAREALAKGGKIVLVISEEEAVMPHDVGRRLGVPSRQVRTLAAREHKEPRPEVVGVSKGPSSKGATSKGATSRFEQGRALVVGVANYARVEPLPEIVLNDARDLGTLLQSPHRCGYPEANVQLLLDQQATAEQFRLGLQRLARESGPDDTVVVFFSGHGLRESGGQQESYLLPIDYDPQHLARTALSATELSRLLSAIRSSRLVVLLDACHSAGAAHFKSAHATATFKSGLNDKTYEVLKRGAGRVVIAASRADELSWVLPGMKNSLFTTYLLEALAGAAAKQGETVVRVLDVFHHISENVHRKAAQHPILKVHEAENNFAIALNPTTKQAPSLATEPLSTGAASNGQVIALPLPPKARLAIKHGLIKRWDDLADYLGIPLADKAKFDRGYEGQRTLEWLEERGRLHRLREAFTHFAWDDLLAELDRHSL